MGALSACTVMAFTTGCASGGYKLTRDFSQWVNSKTLILRIILYIITIPVFGITLLIDAVIFNTMDFWEGRVSSGSYDFKDGNKTYQVRHEFLQDTKLKKSTVQIRDSKQTSLQVVVLKETASHEIEMYVDGKLRTKVNSLSKNPVAFIFNEKGKLIKQEAILSAPMAMN